MTRFTGQRVSRSIQTQCRPLSMPGGLLLGSSNNCSSNAAVDEAAAAATSEEETTTFIAQPSLVGMPASIIIKIIQYTSTDKYDFGENTYASPDFRPDILALERTCVRHSEIC